MIRSAEQEKLSLQVESMLQCLKFRGYGIKINGNFTVRCPQNVSIGNNVHIGENAFFHGYGSLSIEDNVHISRNATIYTYNHKYDDIVLPYGMEVVEKPVRIGKNVWIGMNVSITPGVTIGEGAIVGMGAVVSKDVPPHAIVGNPPTRIIKYRDEDHYIRMENKSSYGGVGGTPLSLDEIQNFKRNISTNEQKGTLKN